MLYLPLPVDSLLSLQQLRRTTARLVHGLSAVKTASWRLKDAKRTQQMKEDDEETLCESAHDSRVGDGFVLFHVEDTVFRVHTSLLRLELSAKCTPDILLKPILRIPHTTADEFQLFLWDLNALSHHLRNPYAQSCLPNDREHNALLDMDRILERVSHAARRLVLDASTLCETHPKKPYSSTPYPQIRLLESLEQHIRQLLPPHMHSSPTTPPPLPLPASRLRTHDHTTCESTWHAIWARAGARALHELELELELEVLPQASEADTEGQEADLLERMDPYLRQLIAVDSEMPMECALAAMELVADMHVHAA
ncbi:hypothetical protein C8F01DRAFT_1112232 [Mycena amicta]|nr:hypothetical protein C8F01DRAFT_1112232 [Mycena amicta]